MLQAIYTYVAYSPDTTYESIVCFMPIWIVRYVYTRKG